MEGSTREEMIVWPPIVILQNTAYPGMRNEQGVQDGATNARLKGLKEEFGAQKAEPVFKWKGHTGITLMRFPQTTEGYLNAVRFARHLQDSKCGKREWENLRYLPKHKQDQFLQRDDALILYGWLADPIEDFEKFKLEDHKARKVRKCDGVQVSESERLARKLQRRKEEMDAEKARVAEILRMRAEAQENQAEKEAIEASKRRAAKNAKVDHAKIRREYKLAIDARLKDLEEEYDRIVRERQEENYRRRKQIMEEHERQEAERLAAAVLKVEEGKKRLDDERARLLAQQEERLKQLMEELETKEEIKGAEDSNNFLTIAQVAADNVFSASNKALLKLLEDRQVNGLYVRQFGTLEDPSIKKIWNDAAVKHLKGKVSNYSAERDAIMRAATKMLENAQWMPFLNVYERRIDFGDKFLTELREKLGAEVEGTVIRALLELEEMNPSGRYRVPKVWHKAENRPPTAEEIAVCLTLLKPKPRCR